MQSSLKPFVKWAGGKRQLLPDIRALLPADIAERAYYEPFVGAGALFFDLLPRRAVINDLNADLILAYQVIRSHVEELIELLKIHADRHCREYYYEVRAAPLDVESSARAARLIYLNKTCYNGLFRVNSRGDFNVPFGRQKNPAICEEALLREMSGYFNSANITMLNTDFEKAVSGADKNSFVYFDPPYHSLAAAGFKNYQARGFDEKDQVRLRDVFLALLERGIPCLLSNADTPFIRNLYAGTRFRVVTVNARRAINSNENGRGRVTEVLITNP